MGREIIGTEIRDYILRFELLQRLFPNLRRKGDMEEQEKYMSEKYFSGLPRTTFTESSRR